jgi:hypothetical protein
MMWSSSKSLVLLLVGVGAASAAFAESFLRPRQVFVIPEIRGGGRQKPVSRSLLNRKKKPSVEPLTAVVAEEETLANTDPLDYNATAVDAGSLSMDTLWNVLRTSPAGLTSAQVEARLAQFGPNQLKASPPKSIWVLIAEQFEDRLVQILLAVALLSGLFSLAEVQQQLGEMAKMESLLLAAENPEIQQAIWKSFVEPAVILAILILNACVGVWQSLSAADSLAALLKLQPRLATVVRGDSVQANIPASQLVPGDVIEVRVGDKIPADARLLSIQSAVLEVDEGSLTGESMTVSKLPGNAGMSNENQILQDQRGMLVRSFLVPVNLKNALASPSSTDSLVSSVSLISLLTPLSHTLDSLNSLVESLSLDRLVSFSLVELSLLVVRDGPSWSRRVPRRNSDASKLVSLKRPKCKPKRRWGLNWMNLDKL